MRDARWVTGAGLAAVAAVVAHAGPAGVTDGRSLAAAATGAAVAAIGLSFAASRTVDARRRTAGVIAGAGGHSIGYARAPFSVVVAAMLALQGAAHAGLLLAGVHAGAGATAAPALHIVLAIAAACIVVAADRAVGSAIAALEQVVAGMIELLTAVSPRTIPTPALTPVRRPYARPFSGRAPPPWA
jgi:hypothetical protein